MRRGFLFWGVALILVGAVPLAVQAGWVDRAALSGAWRLWPVVLVALGVAVLLERTRVAIIGTLAAAVVLGVAAGTALAIGPGFVGLFAGDCSATGAATTSTARDGELSDGAAVRVEFSCGELRATTADGTGWRLAASHRGDSPRVEASGEALRLVSGGTGPAFLGSARRQEWDLTLPTGVGLALEVESNAADAHLDLAGALLLGADVAANAGDMTIDLTDAEVAAVDLSVNAGSMAVVMNRAASGSISVNAGAVELCIPDEVAVSLLVEENVTFGHNLEERGLVRSGDRWRTTGTETPDETIELEIDGNASSLTLNPEGGCG
jgi:hypothetical protein